MFDKQIKATGLKSGVNVLRSDCKVFKLPNFDELGRWLIVGDRVELFLLEENNYSIECVMFPIRFGRYFGNRVFLNSMADPININPSFIFDGEKKQWVLVNAGYVCFAELELTQVKSHTLYGAKASEDD